MAAALPSMDEAIPSMAAGEPSMAGQPADDLPADLQADVAALGHRADAHRVRQVILRLCLIRPRPLSQIAGILGRHPKYVSQQHVLPLVRAGRLAYTIPDEPRHPEQEYRTMPESLASRS